MAGVQAWVKEMSGGSRPRFWRLNPGRSRTEVHMIEASVYETTVKTFPLRKRLQFVRLVLGAILALCITMPLSSAATPGTNSFTDSASVSDRVTFTTT